MTQLTPTGINFDDYDDEQTKPICSVAGVPPDNEGNISLDLSSIDSQITILDNDITDLEQIPIKTFVLHKSTNTVNEGQSVTITLYTSNVFNGGRIPYTITPNGVDLNNDFDQVVSPDGFFEIQDNSDELILTLIKDYTTEPAPESFTLTLDAGDNPSVTVNVNDTSQTPTYNVVPAYNQVDEGTALTIDVSTTDVNDGTTLYWKVSRPEDFSISSGSFQVFGTETLATGSFTVTPTEDNTTEEGLETFTVSISSTQDGIPLATTSDITINDTSQTPTGVFTDAPSGSIILSLSNDPPDEGWVKCDGSFIDYNSDDYLSGKYQNVESMLVRWNKLKWYHENSNGGFNYGTLPSSEGLYMIDFTDKIPAAANANQHYNYNGYKFWGYGSEISYWALDSLQTSVATVYDQTLQKSRTPTRNGGATGELATAMGGSSGLYIPLAEHNHYVTRYVTYGTSEVKPTSWGIVYDFPVGSENGIHFPNYNLSTTTYALWDFETESWGEPKLFQDNEVEYMPGQFYGHSQYDPPPVYDYPFGIENKNETFHDSSVYPYQHVYTTIPYPENTSFYPNDVPELEESVIGYKGISYINYDQTSSGSTADILVVPENYTETTGNGDPVTNIKSHTIFNFFMKL